VQPYDEDEDNDDYFCPFPGNGAPVELNWQGKTEVLGEKPVPVPLCPPQIPHGLTPGSNPGLRGGRPAANRLSHGTAFPPVASVIPAQLQFTCTVYYDLKGSCLIHVVYSLSTLRTVSFLFSAELPFCSLSLVFTCALWYC
jgi:hypothetical protein